MALQQPAVLEQSQRMNVTLETEGGARVYRITMERHDERLGWYIAGSLSLPMHQLPLLQQALAEVGCVSQSVQTTTTSPDDNIIPFPGIG